MNRRAFFRRFGGVIAAVAVAQGVVKKLADTVTSITTKEFVFNPADYAGDWKIKAIVESECERFEVMQHTAFRGSPWIRLVRKSEFPANMGDTKRSV
jgi:hypothetical protein